MACGGVWIADDDSDDQLLYAEALSELGRADGFRAFSDGQTVLSELVARKNVYPCLLILDGRMPVMGGIEVLKALHEQEILQYLRVIILSGALSPADKSFAQSKGVGLYEKPGVYSELLAMMKNVLEQNLASEKGSSV